MTHLLASRDSLIRNIEEEVASKDSQLTALQAQLEAHVEIIAGLRTSETDLHKMLEAKERELADCKIGLVTAEANFAAQVGQFSSTNAERLELQAQLVATEAKIAAAADTIARAELRSESHAREESRLRSSLEVSRIEMDERNSTVAAREITIADLSRTLADLKGREQLLQAEGLSLRDSVAVLHGVVSAKNNLIEDLRAQLLVSVKRSESLQRDASAKDTMLSELRDIQDAAGSRLAVLESDLHVSKTREHELKLTLVEREQELQTKTTEANNLQALLDASARAHTVLRDRLVTVTSQNEVLASQLAAADTRSSSLCADHATAVAEQQQLQKMISQLEKEGADTARAHEAALSEVQKTFDATRTELVDLRATTSKAQSETLVLQASLAMRDAELLEAKYRREADAEEVMKLRTQLEDTLLIATRAEREANELRSAKLQDEKTIRTMRDFVEESLRLQTEILTRTEQKVSDASINVLHTHPNISSRLLPLSRALCPNSGTAPF